MRHGDRGGGGRPSQSGGGGEPPRRARKSRAGASRTLLLRAAVILLGTLLALAALELGLRLARPLSPRLAALLYTPSVRTEYDDAATTAELLARGTLGYKPLGVTPGFVLNSHGLRTDEYADRAAPGVFRVVVLGDSFTFDSYGVPIAQMWHQVFERRLAARSGRTVEVLSLSAPAVGPRFELRLWELEGRRLAPNLVILAFFVGNDFTDEAGVPLEHGVEAGLARHSLAVRLLRNLWRMRGVERAQPGATDKDGAGGTAVDGTGGDGTGVDGTGVDGMKGRADGAGRRRGGFELPSYAATYDPDEPTFDRPAFQRIERDRLRIYAGPQLDGLFADTAAVLERLAREVEASGAGFALMEIPDQAQTDPALRRRLVAALPVGERRALSIDRPQERLAAFLDARAVARLDLLPVFRAAPLRPALYKRRDTHWSAAGNAVAGEALADFIVAAGLGPDRESAAAGAQPPPGSSR